MKQQRPANMTEVYALRADTIDYFFPDRTREIEFWAKLAADYGKDVLHLMCGTGEVAAGLAKKEYNVTGVDITRSMVYKTKERAEKEGLDNVDVLKEDVKYLHLNKKFDLIFISTGDFHHFLENDEIRAVLTRAYAHLREGGALALELFHMPDEDFKREEKVFKPIRKTPPGLEVWKRNSSHYHRKTKTLDIKEELHVEEGGDVTDGEYEIQLRLMSEDEIGEFLSKVGFEKIKKYDEHSDYLEDADTWVVIAER